MKPALDPRLAARVLYELVSVYSPTGREMPAIQAFQEAAMRLHLEAWVDEAGNAYAVPPASPGRKPLVMLIGHMDTVEGMVEHGASDDYVWGRGAVDAKGPLSAMLVAVARVAVEDHGAPVAAAALVGEEGDSRGAKHLVASGYTPRFAVIGEPTGGDGVVVGYRGSVKLLVECSAIGGHPSSPWAGASALDSALEVLQALKTRYPPSGVNHPTITPVILQAGEAPNILPKHASIFLDARIPPGSTLEEILAGIQNLLPPGCTMRQATEYTPPVKVSLNDPVPRAIVKSLLENNVKPRPALKAGTSDMNHLAGHVESIATYGPGDPSLAHTDAERVSVEELELAVKVYEGAMRWLLDKYGDE